MVSDGFRITEALAYLERGKLANHQLGGTAAITFFEAVEEQLFNCSNQQQIAVTNLYKRNYFVWVQCSLQCDDVAGAVAALNKFKKYTVDSNLHDRAVIAFLQFLIKHQRKSIRPTLEDCSVLTIACTVGKFNQGVIFGNLLLGHYHSGLGDDTKALKYCSVAIESAEGSKDKLQSLSSLAKHMLLLGEEEQTEVQVRNQLALLGVSETTC